MSARSWWLSWNRLRIRIAMSWACPPVSRFLTVGSSLSKVQCSASVTSWYRWPPEVARRLRSTTNSTQLAEYSVSSSRSPLMTSPTWFRQTVSRYSSVSACHLVNRFLRSLGETSKLLWLGSDTTGRSRRMARSARAAHRCTGGSSSGATTNRWMKRLSSLDPMVISISSRLTSANVLARANSVRSSALASRTIRSLRLPSGLSRSNNELIERSTSPNVA